MRRSTWAALSALALAIGCTGKVLTVGAGPAPQASSGGTGTTTGSGSGGSANAGVVWTGYLANYKLPSGSDAISLTLETAADGTVTGKTRFGDQPLLPPPTDPDVGYPPATNKSSMLPPSVAPLAEQFEFVIQNGKLDGTRLTFTLDEGQLWTDWCALQTNTYPWYATYSAPDSGAPIDGGLLGYACLPAEARETDNDGTCNLEPLDAAPVPVSCGKLALCGSGPNSICACTATRCSIAPHELGSATFDLQVSGSKMDGATTWLTGAAIDIHLTRAN